ncbi:MAG: HEAT repeat domain-containing protein [Deltaproteobacteria bacterium]|nr:HEAT repeat domain-containing protein [Deltaproteobacteria bacterium]
MRVTGWISLLGLGLLLLLTVSCGGAATPGTEPIDVVPSDAGPTGQLGGAGAGGDAGVEQPHGEQLDPELQALLDDLAAAREPREIDKLARALGDHQHPAAVARLITLLASEQDRIRKAAFDSIERLGDAAVEPLIAALESSEPVQRDRVIGCLATIGDPRAIPALIRVLPATTENQSAARALTRFRKAAVPALLDALADGSGTTRVQAAWALEIMHSSDEIVAALVAALKDEWAPVRAQAASALGTQGIADAVDPLSALVDDPDIEVRMAVAGALVRIGTAEAFDHFDKALVDKDPQVRGAAVDAVGSRRNPALVEKLYAAVGDEHHKVRERAREAVYTIVTHAMKGTASSEIVKRLVEMLRSDDPAARASAAYLLGKLHITQATRALSKALKDTDEDVRWAALTALKDLENPASAKALIGSLRDTDPQIRTGAAELLGMMEIKRAAKPVTKLLRDPETDVRRAAADALQAIPNRAAIGPLIKALGDDDGIVSESAWQALLAIGAPATGKLVAVFKKRKTGTKTRVRIAGLLGHQWKANAAMALIGALNDPDPEVAEIAHLTLQDMTCVQLGPDPADWRSWWKKNKRDKGGDCPGKGSKLNYPDPQEHPPLW